MHVSLNEYICYNMMNISKVVYGLLPVSLLFGVACGLKNVLFIMSDDLRPQINAWTGPDFPSSVSPPMLTPSLDDLASRSLHTTRAYAQYGLCSPSRTSMMTGRRPDTTKVYDLRTHWRNAGGNFTSMPQYFKDNGYISISIGKSFHQSAEARDPISWSEPAYTPPTNGYYSSKNMSWVAVSRFQSTEIPLPDVLSNGYAVETLERLAPAAITGEQPFFLFVGFYKPHLPFSCPAQNFNDYPFESISFPANPFAPINMPEVAWDYMGEFRGYHDIQEANFTGQFNETLAPMKTLELRRAYYACVTYIDALIGELILQLGLLGLANNTIVAFAGDHGFHLGENAHWTKVNNFEQSTHVPMLIHIPGVTDNGIKTNALVELVDFFPTLAEAAGLPPVPQCPEDSSDVPVCTEGSSLVPLTLNASNWKTAAFSQVISNHDAGHMGYAVRTDTYRYVEWPAFTQISDDPPEYVINWDDVEAFELYDHTVDPEENHNAVDDPAYAATRDQLSIILRTGWRGVLPS